MNELTLTQINVFPVKSLGGISQASARVTQRGLEFDRRWMLVDEQGQFITQREYPKLAMLQTRQQSNHFEVSHKHDSAISTQIPRQITTGEPLTVTIWKDQCLGLVAPSELNEWFSERLGNACQLVYMPEQSKRLVDQDYREGTEVVSFADGFPCLLIGQASLDDLNGRMVEPVGMDRFRTNLVFQGGAAFVEDQWRELVMGDVRFRVVKPCPRCTMTTVDPSTGIKQVEPLKTLATYRRDESGGVMFGQNLIPLNTGEIHVGMPIEVVA